MNIPNKVKIGGHIYDVVSMHDHLRVGDGCFGLCDHNNHRILIDRKLPESRQQCTLLHEIIEAINEQYELGLIHPTICTLEQSLYQIFIDNNFIKKE